MIPPSFEYFSPKTLPEAISLLQKSGESAKILAGGQSLIPVMKLRLGSPTHLIDINKIQGLNYVRESDGFLRIGALTRIADLESSDIIRAKYAIVHDAAIHIADPLVRNLGTAGGNLSHADPANDLPATMLATDAEFLANGSKGARVIKAKDFFVDAFTTTLGHEEILTEIRVPEYSAGTGGAYLKLEKRVGDFAIAGVGVQISLDSNGICRSAGIGLTSVGSTALKGTKAEAYLRGKILTDRDVIDRTATLASEASNPTSDLRGPSDYKKEMVKVLTVRALKRAYERASGGA